MEKDEEQHYVGCDAWRSPVSPCICWIIKRRTKDDRNPPVRKGRTDTTPA